MRNFALIREYLRHGFDVTLFSPWDESLDDHYAPLHEMGLSLVRSQPAAVDALTTLAAMTRGVPPYMEGHRRSSLAEDLRRSLLTNVPDYIHLAQLNAFYAVSRVLQELTKRSRCLLDAHNVEYEALRNAASTFPPFRKIMALCLIPNVKRIEQKAARFADLVLACSSEEADYFLRFNPNVCLVANGADAFPPGQNDSGPGSPTVFFMGNLSYPPNEEALRWYFDEIHPRLLRIEPKSEVWILGSTPAWLSDLSERHPSVHAPGFVDDVTPYLSKASVCVSPIRRGSGTSVKILEYMAAGKAVVSTSTGVRGLAYDANVDIAIADDADTFARKVAELLASPQRREQMGLAALSRVRKSNDWRSIGDHLIECLQSLEG
jgi:glycosyltransferase involved in cell wall biosynthesis